MHPLELDLLISSRLLDGHRERVAVVRLVALLDEVIGVDPLVSSSAIVLVARRSPLHHTRLGSAFQPDQGVLRVALHRPAEQAL